MDFATSFALIAPELVLTGTGMLLLLIAAWGGDARAQLNTYLACVGLFVAGILLVPTLHDGLMGPDTHAFGDLMRADAYSAFAKSLIYLGAIGCLLVAPSYFNRLNAMRAEYPVLIVFASLGMSIMVSAGDFLTLYLGLELNSLAAYVLASILRTDGKSAEAGLKYFVLGALASGILLYGISLVYGFTGSTSFVGVSA
ncbi:MAG: NADH-quinone oxidoreductase subunit N, partial [Altererythrobacter sp.]|nr:NADH-quinone oxidoreductase subunit N [Altererythrobacter sp.]